MRLRKNRLENVVQQAWCTPKWVKLSVGVGLLILVGSCRHSRAHTPSDGPAEIPAGSMFVADLGVDIIVEDIDAVLCRFEFVQALGGYIAAVSRDDRLGIEEVTVEFRVPHEHTGRVADILRSEFGEVTYINVFSADVSVRNERLRRELSALEESVGESSGNELMEVKAQIEILRDSIAFQLERQAFLFVEVHLVASH